MHTLLRIFFLPPMAFARLGSSEEPLESFDWAEDETAHGGGKTIIVPTVSLRVLDDGALEPYVPERIRFKDGEAIRPVAPFFELWATVQSDEDGHERDIPVTLSQLAEWGLTLGDVRYDVTAANLKAARRTGSRADSFTVRIEVEGDDHARHELRAWSPHTADQEPLVFRQRPIPLGAFQVIRPTDEKVEVAGEAIDLSVVRIRYTPARGEVYGPPTATSGPASPIAPGLMYPARAEYGRVHEIVPEKNRVLNPRTAWSTYKMDTGLLDDPEPRDSYDGANVGSSQSWGVVDDSCDVVVVANLRVGGRHLRAVARAFTGPPDFSPDSRPIYSVSDDLADRELPLPELTEDMLDETLDEILDLFHRAFETARLFNLDAGRQQAVSENLGREADNPVLTGRDLPKTNQDSMTAEDRPFVDKIPELVISKRPSTTTKGVAHDRVPYAEAVPFVHAPLMEEEVLLDFLLTRTDHVRRLIRPSFGAFSDFQEDPGIEPNPRFRDPRVYRDTLYDMRMPPYMRDSGMYPLSLTRRQYRTVLAFLDQLEDPEVAQKLKRRRASRRRDRRATP